MYLTIIIKFTCLGKSIDTFYWRVSLYLSQESIMQYIIKLDRPQNNTFLHLNL